MVWGIDEFHTVRSVVSSHSLAKMICGLFQFCYALRTCETAVKSVDCLLMKNVLKTHAYLYCQHDGF